MIASPLDLWAFLMQFRLHNLVYYTCVSSCTIHAFVRGGRDEKIGATLLVIGSIATTVGGHYWPEAPGQADISTLIVDSLLLTGIVALVFRSDRFWPIWVAGFHLLNVCTHLIPLFGFYVEPIIYYEALIFWSYLVWLSLVIGTEAYWRQGGTRRELALQGIRI